MAEGVHALKIEMGEYAKGIKGFVLHLGMQALHKWILREPKYIVANAAKLWIYYIASENTVLLLCGLQFQSGWGSSYLASVIRPPGLLAELFTWASFVNKG